MSVKTSEKILKKNLKLATLVLLLRDKEILLAMKKRGFGMGKWNGTGGKVKDGESIEEAAKRECEEEILVTPKELKKVAVMNYYFPKDVFGMEVHIFTCKDWGGTPGETEEMKPMWFKIKNIPYEAMWSGDPYWMPKVLDEKLIKGDFEFGEGGKITDYSLKEVKGF